MLAQPRRIDALAHRDDLARSFQAEDRRSTRRGGIIARTLDAVGTVDPRIGDLQQDLARPGLGHRHVLLQPEHLGSAGLGKADRLHGVGYGWHRFPPKIAVNRSVASPPPSFSVH